jgi:hypothetical protein
MKKQKKKLNITGKLIVNDYVLVLFTILKHELSI